MTGFFVFLCFLLVIAIAAIAVWLWMFIGIVDQVAALIRIKAEEQIAVWKIESISRISKLEQERLRDEYKAR